MHRSLIALTAVVFMGLPTRSADPSVPKGKGRQSCIYGVQRIPRADRRHYHVRW